MGGERLDQPETPSRTHGRSFLLGVVRLSVQSCRAAASSSVPIFSVAPPFGSAYRHRGPPAKHLLFGKMVLL